MTVESSSDQNRVFSLPNPGGDAPIYKENRSELDDNEFAYGSNPLLSVANPLVNLIYQIRTLVQISEPEELRSYLVAEVKKFSLRGKQAGLDGDALIAARYCLCTVLDETAAQTPWGGSGVWSRHSLLVTFHNETWGGEKFFQLLSKLLESPKEHFNLLELMYYCICMGFEGRYRVATNGATELEAVRLRLADTLRQVKGERSSTLSRNWRGLSGQAAKVWNIIPVWVTGILSVVLAALIYLFFSFYLSSSSDAAFLQISQLQLPEVPRVVRSTYDPKRLARFLEQEITDGLVTVRETEEDSTVTILGDGLYDSASANIKQHYIPVLSRVADALAQVNGSVEVVGHTDNLPIRTIRYPSNWDLSVDRAQTVANILRQNLPSDRQIVTQGRASVEPIAPNDTAENRALNRRVEITVYVTQNDNKYEIK